MAKRGFFLKAGTTDQHKFLARPAANRVQRMGNQGLASARFTFDQNMAIGLPQIQNVFFAAAP